MHYQEGRLSSMLILSSSSFSISLRFRLASKHTSYFFIFPWRHCSFLTLSAILRYSLAIWFSQCTSCSFRRAFSCENCCLSRERASALCFSCCSAKRDTSESDKSFICNSSLAFCQRFSKVALFSLNASISPLSALSWSLRSLWNC